MRFRFTCAAMALAALVAAPAVPQEGPPEVSPDQMMEMMKKMAEPGPAHAVLARMVGEHHAVVKSWMDPAAPPIESKGKMKTTSILGGRYTVDEYEGSMMGEPFQGMGVNGYDKQKKEYVSTWVDNWSTAILVLRGQYDEATNTMTMEGSQDDPVTGGTMKLKSVTRPGEKGTTVFEMFMGTPDGQWIKSMEIVYTKAK